MMLNTEQQLRRILKGLADIRQDLIYVRDTADWAVENYLGRLGRIDPDVYASLNVRTAVLDGLLIRYRRCFASGQRVSLRDENYREVIDDLWLIHREELIDRANQVVAHAISACSSTQIYVAGDHSITFSTIRSGINRFDFQNLSALSHRWLEVVDADIEAKGKELIALSPTVDDKDASITAYPFGSRTDLQADRSRRAKPETRGN